MKKMHRFLALGLMLALMLSFVPAYGASSRDTLDADTLYTLGLLRGSGAGFAPDSPLTRAEAVTLAVRLAGGETRALSGAGSHPFTDVPVWASAYVGWAYEAGLTRGLSAAVFGSSRAITGADFVTLVLRVLGYDTENFSALSVGSRLGLCRSRYDSFLRRDAFAVLCCALTVCPADSEVRLADRLCQQGVLDAAVLNAVGLGADAPMDAAEIYRRCAGAVFCMYTYTSDAYYVDDVYEGTASGFFLRSDGLAVTNFHAISSAWAARVTLMDGSSYPVERVIYQNAQEDIAVLKISTVSTEGRDIGSFACLPLGDFDRTVPGQKVFTISCPLALQGTITEGIISVREREVEDFSIPLIQNTASISQGSSGGAMLNQWGQVIGVACAYYVNGFDLYLAVPVYAIQKADLNAQGITLPQLYQQQEAQPILGA